MDKQCSIKLKRGEEPQFGKWLKWLPHKKSMGFEGRRGWVDNSGRKSFNRGSGGSGSGSDAPSWRKQDNTSQNSKGMSGREEKEGTSPLMLTEGREKIIVREEESGMKVDTRQTLFKVVAEKTAQAAGEPQPQVPDVGTALGEKAQGGECWSMLVDMPVKESSALTEVPRGGSGWQGEIGRASCRERV